MPTVTVNGARLNVVQLDEGAADGAPREDLVMVHGLATNLAFWYLPYAPVFARRFRVTLFDLRGMGRSEITPDGYTPQNLARDLGALMDALGIARAHLVAHSFGGVVALNFAVRHPARVRSLVLCDSHVSAVRHAGVRRDWGHRAELQLLAERHGLALDTDDPYFGYRLLTEIARMQLHGEPVPAELAKLVAPILGAAGRRTATQWLKLVGETSAADELMGDDGLALDALRRLLFPILALYGDHSQARITGGELLDVWPHAEFRRVRDAGHFFPTSRPDDVIRECERFWRGEYARGAVVRAGEAQRRHFRSDRVFQRDGRWYYTTREDPRVGPFDSAEQACDALALHFPGLALPA